MFFNSFNFRFGNDRIFILFIFFSEQNYWAKDIIFLVTEHEQLGMQAWLDAYHGVTSGIEGVLEAGDLPGRAGSIQAAINLEFHAMTISSIDVKVIFCNFIYLYSLNFKNQLES